MTIYDLIADFGREAVAEWLSGDASLGEEPPADEATLSALAGSWEFWARPGQRWTQGPETITYYSAGRGFGKSLVLSNVLGEAALEPARWGYEALLVGITPGDARALLEQDTGAFAVARAYGYPYPEVKWTTGRGELFYPAPDGETRGLHVRVASSANPGSARGPNVGLLVADEWAFFKDVTDEQGYTAWEAARSTLRIGDAKAVIVSSPSRKPAVREMRRLAEEPVCADRIEVTPDGPTMRRGCNNRLPRIEPRRISPLFSATTTEPARTCPHCGATVIAEVRLIRASSLDNAHLHPAYQELAMRSLATGTRQARGEYGGEILDDDTSSPIASIRIDHLDMVITAPDPWWVVRESLGLTRVVVAVDPATTAGESSADSGVIAAGLVRPNHGEQPRRVIGLQDESVPASDVVGSPSRVWAPRAAILAALWRASHVIVETNQGGLEVLDPMRQALAKLTAKDLQPYTTDARVIAAALASARACVVEGVTRRTKKPARWDWASTPAATGDLRLARSPWLPPEHWSSTVAHLTRFVPEGDRRATKEPIDRGDTLISAAQHLLGVREAGPSQIVDPTRSPMYTTSGLLR